MKLLFCTNCGDILAPLSHADDARFCKCNFHAVWWKDPVTGILRIYESGGRYDPPNKDYVGGPDKQPVWQRKRSPHRAFILGLHNGFLGHVGSHSSDTIKEILQNTPPSYLFQRHNSVIVRFRPGETDDTDWAEALP